MANSESKTKCGPCHLQDVEKEATLWCQQCEEGLCEDCDRYHKVFKATSKHNTILIESFETLPIFIQGIELVCFSHNKKLDLFCGIHQEPCCTECVSLKHTTCGGISLLSKVVQGVKESEYVSTLRNDIVEQRKLAEKLRENRNENESRLQEQKRMLHDKVTLIRKSIVDHLDRLETKIKNEIDSIIDSKVASIKKATFELENTALKLDDAEKNISILGTYCAEMQTYLGLKEIEKYLEVSKRNLLSLLTAKDMRNVSVSIDISEVAQNFTSEMDTFGRIRMTEEEVGISIQEMNPGIAQMSKPLDSIIYTIHLNLINRSKIPNQSSTTININSAVILHDGRNVLLSGNLSDANGYFYIFDENGFYIRKIDCNFCPFGMAILGENELLVSSCSSIYHFVYDANFNITKTIVNGYKLFGLSFDEGQVVSAMGESGISVSKTLDKIIKIFPVYRPLYIHCANEKIFVTDRHKHTLVCLEKSTGEKLWECKFDEMKGPRNVCSDKFGNIFVSATDSDKVLMISSDGTKCKQILDNIVQPKAICFDNSGSKLLVAGRTGAFSLYNVTYE